MKWFLIAFFCTVTFFVGLIIGRYEGFSKGFDAGKTLGMEQVQTPAFIVETCSAWWWGSNKEATKMLKKYCEMKK